MVWSLFAHGFRRMIRDCILGTAGHIDHGKTALVQALTGVNCDRLPEEKARGITIDIGFAELHLGDVRIGIVDVPGHEKFIRNMLAGATGIDLALLVVAADDGIMPQTREHFGILKLLKLRNGLIAIAKCDLASEDELELLQLELREMIAGSFLENAAILSTSARTGQGIDELKLALAELTEAVVDTAGAMPFRLHIDRAFTRPGHGTVVTGTVAAGRLHLDDKPTLHKSNGSSEIVSLRGLHHHSRSVAEIRCGQRAAINLAGVDHHTLARGDVLAHGEPLLAGAITAVHLTAATDGTRGIRNRLTCRLHLGTADLPIEVSLLDADRLAPGTAGLAQLIGPPTVAVHGQPFVLRDSAGRATLGGGTVLLPNAPKIRRKRFDSILILEKFTKSDPHERAEAAYFFRGVADGRTANLAVIAGIVPAEQEAITTALVQRGTLTALANGRLVSSIVLQDVEAKLMAVLSEQHRLCPLHTNHDRAAIISQLDYVDDAEFLSLVVDRLVKSKQLVAEGRRLARADFKPKLSVNQRKLKDRIVASLHAAGLAPPEAVGFANLAGGRVKDIEDILEVACAEGLLIRIAPEFVLHGEREAEARSLLRQRMMHGPATLAEIRDCWGTTRKFAVPLCEYYDKLGVTIRDGDLRTWNGTP